MGLFTKLKNGKLKEHKTIGEKKEEYLNRVNDKSLSKIQRNYASKKLQELNDLTEKKTAISKTFAGKDVDLTGHTANSEKVRYGVCTKVRKDGSVNINPFMPKKESEIEKNKQVAVEAQKKAKGREHAVRVKSSNISIDDICEDKGFPEKETRELTQEEFRRLKNLSKGNKKNVSTKLTLFNRFSQKRLSPST